MWCIAWAALLVWAPPLLQELDAGLVAQVVAPSAVALFALVLASTFVAAQTASGLYGARLGLLIVSDHQLVACVARLIVLLLLSVGLVVPVRTDGSSSPATAAAMVVLIAALALEALRAANDLAVALSLATAPRIASGRIVSRAVGDLVHGVYGHVPWMAGTLGEMVQMSLRRGDGVAVAAASDQIVALHGLWAVGAADLIGWREPYVLGRPASRGWLTLELASGLSRNVDEALRSLASANEVDSLTDALGEIAQQAIEHGLAEEASIAIHELTAAGTTANQVAVGVVNVITQPSGWLADAETVAEERKLPAVAALALANWALCMANIYQRFHRHHPYDEQSLKRMGPEPPWDAAREIVRSADWQSRWINQLYGAPEFVEHVLDVAEANYNGDWGPPTAELFPSAGSSGASTGAFTRLLGRWLSRVAAVAMEELANESADEGAGYPGPRPLAVKTATSPDVDRDA